MIKVPITYEDFDGKTVTEEHYFHLSKNELVDMIAANDGEDLQTRLERIGKSGNGALIMKEFRAIISQAYGQRVDGSASEFFKSPEITAKFMGSLAFDQLFMDLILNETSAAAFVNGLLPSGLDKLAAVAEKEALNRLAAEEGLPPVQDVELPGGKGYNYEFLQRQSGLKVPIDGESNPLPWATREPTEKELTTMTQPQLLDVMRRKNAGWTPHSSGVPATA